MTPPNYNNRFEKPTHNQTSFSKVNPTYHEYSIYAIDGMDGHHFEFFCAELLQKNGFSNVTVTPGSGDQGVDILAEKDGVKYAIQCKNYASALSNTPVQEVAAGMQFYGCHVGVVMTNSTFTPSAVQLASATNILLWNRRKLDELISNAGGLRNLSTYVEYADFYDDGMSTEYDAENQTFIDNFDTCNKPRTIKAAHPRKWMRLWFRICIAWSILCFFISLIALIASDSPLSKQMMLCGLGEGLFVLVLGLMFGALSKTDKWDPDITVFGVYMKKYIFVLICIAIAYAFFLGTLLPSGVLSVNKI